MNINYSLKKMSVCFVVLVFLFLGSFVFSSEVQAGFRFVAWADTRGNNTELAHLSNQVKVYSKENFRSYCEGLLSNLNFA